MTWLSWRQQRTETLITAVFIVLMTALFVPTGLHMASLFDQEHLSACVGRNTNVCHDAVARFAAQFGLLRSVFGWFALLPGVIGAALAMPLVLDLESGGYRLVWTQSVTRGRWLAPKLGLAIVTTVTAALALSLVIGWYRGPLDALYGRMDGAQFGLEGIAPAGYVLFALGLTLAVGVVWRRTAPSLVAGLAGYVGVRVFVDGWLRSRYATPLSATWPIDKPGPSLSHAWVLSEGPSDRLGHPFVGSFDVLQSCARSLGNSLKSVDSSCLARARRGVQPRGLAAGEPVLALPGDRDGALRRARARAPGGSGALGLPAHELTQCISCRAIRQPSAVRTKSSRYQPHRSGTIEPSGSVTMSVK